MFTIKGQIEKNADCTTRRITFQKGLVPVFGQESRTDITNIYGINTAEIEEFQR